MKVFSGFFKILKANKGVVFMYLGIFIGLIIIFSQTLKVKPIAAYEEPTVNVYLECEDDNKHTKEILSYFDKYIEYVNIKNSTVEDELFLENIDMYIKIEEGFFDKLLSGEENIITIKTTPSNLNAYSLQSKITSFLNQIKVNISEGISTPDTVVSDVVKLNESLNDLVITNVKKGEEQYLDETLYNIGFYVLCALIFAVTIALLFAYKPLDIKRRMEISAISRTKLNIMLIIANALFAIILSVVIYLVIVLVGGLSFTNGIYYLLNYVFYAVTTVIIAYAITALIESKIAIDVISVIVPLGGAFLSGVFVPRFLLGDTVKLVSRVFPQSFSVDCVEYLSSSETISVAKFFGYQWPMLIYIGIALGVIFITNKIKSTKEC